MKADLDETIENLNEGLKVSENSEVLIESSVQKPTLKMTTAQMVETSVTNNSSFQNYTHPDDHTTRTTNRNI